MFDEENDSLNETQRADDNIGDTKERILATDPTHRAQNDKLVAFE
jgi:hypothetical protein